MSSHVLVYVLIAAAWTAFIVGVTITQGREQKQLQEPHVDEPGDDPEPELAAAA